MTPTVEPLPVGEVHTGPRRAARDQHRDVLAERRRALLRRFPVRHGEEIFWPHAQTSQQQPGNLHLVRCW